jgi:glycosyltransferase involved in cell wall biosynthesis
LVSRKASKVVTVSEFELKRISQTLPDIKNKLDYIYNAVNDGFSEMPTRNSDLSKKLPDNFFFFLGNTDPKKNTLNVIRAFVHYRRNLKGTLPLVVGDFSKDYLLEILNQNIASELIDEIITLGYINNNDLPFIYKRATGFLYPSLRESFGIPILEAMACGCPVITSNVSSMPEIAGEAAIQVSPLDTKSISDALLQIEKNIETRNQMKSKGLEQASKFSWSISAKKYASLYSQAA